MNILFVCTGNTCRSPMAEGYLRDILNKNGENHNVSSAGVQTIDDMKASKNAIYALSYDNIDISNHKSKMIDSYIILNADIILTMGNSHKQLILSYFPQVRQKIFTLKEFVSSKEEDVLDPFGGDLNVYMSTSKEIKELVYKLYGKISRNNREK